MEIKPLGNTSFDIIFTAWEDAFSEYERTRTKAELRVLLQRRGYVSELSFGAFDGNKLVSFTLNGIGLYNGIMTAYDTGTGTLKEYSGNALSTKIFNESMPVLRQAGIVQYLLEVLQHNAPAVAVYRKIGFKVTRQFNYFIESIDKITPNSKALPPEIELRGIDLSQRDEMMNMWDFAPSWQNSFEAISRNPTEFSAIGAFNHNNLIGYGIVAPGSGDIAQLGVHKLHRRKGIGSGILKKLLSDNQHSSAQVINTELNLEHITKFIEHNGIPWRGAQFEMMLPL